VGDDRNCNPAQGRFLLHQRDSRRERAPEKFTDDLWTPTDYPKPGVGMEKLTFFTSELFGGQVFPAVQGKPGAGCASCRTGCSTRTPLTRSPSTSGGFALAAGG
jgi:hypothetical protein